MAEDFAPPDADAEALRAVGHKLQLMAKEMQATPPAVQKVTKSMESHWGDDSRHASAATAQLAYRLARQVGDQADLLGRVAEALIGLAAAVARVQDHAGKAWAAAQVSPGRRAELALEYRYALTQLERQLGDYTQYVRYSVSSTETR